MECIWMLREMCFSMAWFASGICTTGSLKARLYDFELSRTFTVAKLLTSDLPWVDLTMREVRAFE